MKFLVIYPAREKSVLGFAFFAALQMSQVLQSRNSSQLLIDSAYQFLETMHIFFFIFFLFSSLRSPRSSDTNKCELYIHLELGEYQKHLVPYLLYLAPFQAAD